MIRHVKDPQLFVMRVGNVILIAGFYVPYRRMLNRDINKIKSNHIHKGKQINMTYFRHPLRLSVDVYDLFTLLLHHVILTSYFVISTRWHWPESKRRVTWRANASGCGNSGSGRPLPTSSASLNRQWTEPGRLCRYVNWHIQANGEVSIKQSKPFFILHISSLYPQLWNIFSVQFWM